MNGQIDERGRHVVGQLMPTEELKRNKHCISFAGCYSTINVSPQELVSFFSYLFSR
jgi:hypothetical protein